MRKLVWFTVGFALACLAGALMYGGWLLIAGIAMLILAGMLSAMLKISRKYALPLLCVLGCAAGLFWFGAYDQLFVGFPRVADGQVLSVTIEVSDYSTVSGYGSAAEGLLTLDGKEYRVKAYLNSKDELSPGDQINGSFRFRLTTDGGLDSPTHHRTEGIFLLVYCTGRAEITKAESISFKHYPAIWRRQILNRIHEVLPGEAGGFAAALLLGERSGISYETDTAFRSSGISHIIAVSGLHVSILFGLIYTLLARRRVLSCVIGIPALFLFAAIVGFTPSITRACIMQSLMLLAMLLDKEYDGPTALAFAVLAMLIVNPLTVLSVSFQLSVSCMLGIFLFSERIRQWLYRFADMGPLKGRKRLGKLYKGIAASVSVSVGATIVTTPLVAFYFGCVSVFGVLTNLLTLWVISFIFYGLLFCLLVSLLHMGFAQVLAGMVSILIHFVLSVAKGISQLPFAAIFTSNPYVLVWLIGAYILLAVYMLQKKKRPALLLSCVVFTMLLTQLFSWLEPLQDDFRVTMVDVGQGQSILLQSDGKTFLVDCGGDYGEDAADETAEVLLNQGISRLDGIIVTHYDTDHTGGVAFLLTRISADRLILPYLPQEQEAAQSLADAAPGAVEYISSDVRYEFGSTEMTIFAPISHKSANESGICILFQRKDCGILITGDRGFSGEAALMGRYQLPPVDILVAGHHGSAGSTSRELLETVSPDSVWISVGADNSYGHPADALLQRLCETNCTIYRTDIHGTIIFRR